MYCYYRYYTYICTRVKEVIYTANSKDKQNENNNYQFSKIQCKFRIK